MSDKPNTELFLRIRSSVLREAANARTNAGYDGRWDDGGASRLEAIVEAWWCGLQGNIPPEFEKHYKQVANEADPEWAEHLRLMSKFGNKS